MTSDPYKSLAEILEGALSLTDYYTRKMDAVPATVASARAALSQVIADLRALSTEKPERSGDI